MVNNEQSVIDVTQPRTKDKNYSKLPNVLRPGYVAPDGGWGWIIIVAAGFSNLCTLALIQSYGLIFRAYFRELGLNASQSSTIININAAIISLVGLMNGPLFRKFSVRQVACVGALVCTVSISVLSFMKTFHTILLFFAVFYASGNSLSMSSCALALNMYFKKKKRLAIGLAWTITGISPIIVPQLVTMLLPIYDVSGTILLFGGMTFNAFACALLLQPVNRHARKESKPEETETCGEIDDTKFLMSQKTNNQLNTPLIAECNKVLLIDDVCHPVTSTERIKNRMSQGFGSQYLYYDDEQHGAIGLDVISSETQMMSRANDGWYSKLSSSNNSLSSRKTVRMESSQQMETWPLSPISNRQLFPITSSAQCSIENLTKLSIEEENCREKKSRQSLAPETEEENTENYQKPKARHEDMFDKSANVTDSLLGKITSIQPKANDVVSQETVEIPWYTRALHAINIFFDLDLLRDPVYVNLMIGVTTTSFADVNFFVLTPFILSDIGLKSTEIANVMSILAIVDVITRLMIPFIATRIGGENRIYFMVAMSLMSIGRILFAHVRSYNMVMASAVLIGAAKAFRTIFFALVIPTHVPLERLPAATGIQLATSGMIYLMLGPIVGWIRDGSENYTVTLHCLNILPCLVMISWTLEIRYHSIKRNLLTEKFRKSTLTRFSIDLQKCPK